ncbi:MAG: TIGR01777 family oxidoreductase [Kiritimatiellia bacterium]
MTGATGLIGNALCEKLRRKQYCVRTLSRKNGDFKWNVNEGYIDRHALDRIDCIIHLAGETIAQRWTETAKQKIMQSRIRSTGILTREILRQDRHLLLICASGINYYGFDRPELLTEKSSSGEGFLAEVCRQWENTAVTEGITVKTIRTGVVLTPEGGMLKKILPPFKLGLGGHIGSGQQMMSWISLEDICRVYIHAIENDSLTGAVNAVAPEPVSNREFTKLLSKALHRPAVLPLPSLLIKTLFGRMGTETVLSNLRVKPEKLLSCDFSWTHPDIDFL